MKSTLLFALVASTQAKQREMPKPIRSGDVSRIEKSHAKLVRGPISPVGLANSTPICLFQDDDNQWCLQTIAPMLKAGWNW